MGLSRTFNGAQSLDEPELIAGLLARADRPVPAPALNTELFHLRQLDVAWDQERSTLWTFMNPVGRPSFNPAMLKDFQTWQSEIVRMFGSSRHLRYLVLGSRFPGVFGLGGDLALFADRIRARDRQALADYGRACVRILYRNMVGLDLPLVTIGLAQGDALGGGFEALLSFNVVVAERGARFGLPEASFGLFPGMGAHCFLARRLGSAKAERMILNGAIHTAEEMYELGIVHMLAEPGEGEAAVKAYIRQHSRRHGGDYGVYRATRAINPITLDELERVVDVWADAALQLTEHDLKLMMRIAAAQTRLIERRTAG